MSRTNATLIGFTAVLMWAVLAALTAASGMVPPFQLAAMTIRALPLDWRVWALAVGGLGDRRLPADHRWRGDRGQGHDLQAAMIS